MKTATQLSTAANGGSGEDRRPMVIACGADIAFPTSDACDPLRHYLISLKRAVEQSSAKALCFTPTAYGTVAQIQSLKDSNFAHHTLPCPAIPIPRGADFIGRHISQIETDVHMPLPDAFRTFQLSQAIRNLQRAGEPLLLHAHTPGIIGYSVLRESFKRRRRGKPVPIMATHMTTYRPFVEARMVEIVNALRLGHSLSLNEFFTHGGLLEKLVPILHDTPDLRAGIERLIIEAQNVVHHWYSAPNASDFRANRTWGRMLLWIANAGSRYAHHRLQGSVAAANAFHEFAQLLSSAVGVPMSEIRKQPFDSGALVDDGIQEISSQLVRGYLSRFYLECDRVLNLEGEYGRADLSSLGISDDKIVDLDLRANISEQLCGIYTGIVKDSANRITPKRVAISDFEWGPAVEYRGQRPTAHLAMSDVHLGDGSGTERAKAAMELKPHFDRLEIECIEIVGDLIQRDVSPEVSARHRESFLAALSRLTTRISCSERSVINLKVEMQGENCSNSKRQSELRKEMHDFAIKVGARLEFDGALLGIPPHTLAKSIPVYIERGNHDEGEQLETVIPGSTVSASMIRLDRTSGVLFCHGNIWNLPEVPLALKQATSLGDLSNALAEPELRSSLETAQVIYSMTSALWRACAKRIDVRSLWKNDLQPSLSQFVNWYRVRSHAGDSSPSEYSRFLSGVISPVDNAAVAAQCGIVARGFDEFCWAVCDGHSHRPSIEFVTEVNPQTGEQAGLLLVNCGKFHGKNITVVALRFPEAVIFEWDERDQTYYVLLRYRLSEQQICRVTESPSQVQSGAKNVNCNSPTTKLVRTLLEICTEGSGHAERQLSLLPLYEEHGTVQVAASGHRLLPWAHEHWPGHQIVYDETGSVRNLSTMTAYLRHRFPIAQKAKELVPTLEQYTHAITDFAPVLPTAMQLAHKAGYRRLPPLFHVSHHAAMHSRYPDTPKPAQLDRFVYWATQRYLNSISGDVNIGFHFERYHADIFTPPLAPDILRTKPTFNSNIVLVYLNGMPAYIAEQCGLIDPAGEHEWHIYSSQQKQIQKSRFSHIWLYPLASSYRHKLPHARAVLTVSGFMGPAELIHLGKPFVVMPTPGHGEQAFNAAALREISDIGVVSSISNPTCQQLIRKAFDDAKAVGAPIQRTGRMGKVGPYQDVRTDVVRQIFGV